MYPGLNRNTHQAQISGKIKKKLRIHCDIAMQIRYNTLSETCFS